jgi:hypothetical protein
MFHLFSFVSLCHARSCDRDEYDKAEYFAEIAGKKVVDKYGGGRDVRVRMNSCNYNSYSGIYKTKIEIYWNGAIFRSNKYNIDGELQMKSDGSRTEFSETYANDNVKDIRFMGYVAGGIIVLGAIVVESQLTTPPQGAGY